MLGEQWFCEGPVSENLGGFIDLHDFWNVLQKQIKEIFRIISIKKAIKDEKTKIGK